MSESLQAKLAAARRRWRTLQTLGGLAASFTVVVLLALVSFYTDRLLVLGTPGRWGWLLALVGGALLAKALKRRGELPREFKDLSARYRERPARSRRSCARA